MDPSPETPPVRLLVVLSGGGSLGSYSAGVADALVRSLDEAPAGSRPVVSAVVGASAGALTGALLVRALVDDRPGSLEALERAWVHAMDIEDFIGTPPDEVDPLGFFEADTVVGRFHAFLDAPGADAERRPFAADPLVLAYALTDPRGSSIRPPAGGPQGAAGDGGGTGPAGPVHDGARRHRAARRYRIGAAEPAGGGDALWRRIREEGPASSATPFYFPPRAVDGPGGPRWMVDGGVLANHPVDLALEVAAEEGWLGEGGRVVVLWIDPSPAAGAPPPWTEPGGKPDRMGTLLGAVWAAVLEESQSRRWVEDGLPRGVRVVRVAPGPEEPPAGAFLWGLGGFFERSWRRHDFALGGVHLRRALATELGVPTEVPPLPPRPLPSPSWEALPKKLRRRFLRFVRARTVRLLEAETGLPWPLRWPAAAVAAYGLGRRLRGARAPEPSDRSRPGGPKARGNVSG